MNLAYINRVAPHHDRTSCADDNVCNGRFAPDDLGGCYRCTLLDGHIEGNIDTVAPKHEKTSCSDAQVFNSRVDAQDHAGCYRCTLLEAARED